MSFREDVDARTLQRGQVRLDASRWATVLLPSPLSLAFAVSSVLALVPGGAFAVWALVGDGAPTKDDVGAAIGAMMLFAMPPSLLLMLPTMALAGPHGARAAYGAVATLLTLALCSTLAVGGLAGGLDPRGALCVALVSVTPWAMIGLGSAVMARTQLRLGLARDRRRRALALLQHFGSISEDDLQTGLGGTHAQLVATLAQLDRTAPVHREQGRVWTAARHAARQALVVATVEAGERSLAGLAEQAREPEDVVLGWLEQLRTRGVLDVRVVGDALEVGGEAANAPCAGCGGVMRDVGGRLQRCPSCGNERMLAFDAVEGA